ncbi:glycosyltransferase family 4 protein [Croceicoccus hydrothermalis]|uniref:glycosyltransferase family 4 protein n=1 Tax=Croceicoccus hydrothermalis TaxID=2867964 RepID=UPI001EFBA63E|nr:glycosyltransferase family 4 protein [Croceicoccus hydrothermalis]
MTENPVVSDVVSLFQKERKSADPANEGSDPVYRRVALIGTYTPRQCGIATFTGDIVEQLARFHPEIALDIYAMDDPAQGLSYDDVAGTIAAHDAASYARAARRINESGVDAVWLQHEYGIFGGTSGEMVLDLVDRLAAPLVLTLHTVLADPSERQREILDHLLNRASRVMVMSRHSANLLAERYGVGADRVAVIEHGAPDRPFGRQAEFKARMGLEGRRVLTSFGLLGPGKGLENVIEALPAIVARHPETIYRIVGATHPNLVAQEGESYRDGLKALAERLGVTDHVVWDNRFVDTDELLDQLESCDIYITAYPNMQQSTSGTLSYAVALGKAVVSTPYLHARELLSDGVGEFVAPGDSEGIARAVNGLLDEPERLEAMQRRAYARGRKTIWPRFADATASLLNRVVARQAATPVPLLAMPGMSGFTAMCDDTGMYQHAIGRVPDRRHGYCVDDNARALMLVNVAEAMGDDEAARMASGFASFIQQAWNPDRRRFRNFMGFDRRWCEEEGSDDSNGRSLWALGQTCARGRDEDLRWWAKTLFDEALPAVAELDSPRTVAFTMLGAAGRLAQEPDREQARAVLENGGAFLCRLIAAARRPDWAWFEAVVGYDNPRLSQALIEAGRICGRDEWLEAGLSSLAWINEQQRSATGNFRPVGSDSFNLAHEILPFDQQPLEALAAIEAAAAAFAVTGEARWFEHARIAYCWFFGGNDRGVHLADIRTGHCRDGITPRGANRNCGAESILAFQLSYYAMTALARSQPGNSTGDLFENQRLSGKSTKHIR